MIKVASIILLTIFSIASGEDEIELNEKGCPVDTMIYKILPDENNCNQFYKCSNGEPVLFKCPDKLAFNLNENVCDWPNQVDCGSRTGETPAPETPAPEIPAPETDDQPKDAASICARDLSDGILVEHEYCNHLYMCARGVPVDVVCPEPLLFNTDSKLCDWEDHVECGERMREKEPEKSE